MLSEILHEIAGQFEQGEEHTYYPRPSIAGPDRCIRQMSYWRAKEQPKPLPGRTLHVFSDGNMHENKTIEWIKKSAYQFSSEQMPISFDFNFFTFRGSIDGVLTDILGDDYVLEHKGINHFTFERYWRLDEIPWDYIAQCVFYIKGTSEINPDIHKAVLLIKNKNTSQFMEYILEYHEDCVLIKECINSTGEVQEINILWYWPLWCCAEKFQEIEQHYLDQSLPERQYFIDHWRCQYCQYGTTCYEDYRQEFKALSDDVAFNEEFEQLCAYYLETNMHQGEMKKEKEKLREDIVSKMKALGSRKGRAGEYNISLSLQTRNSLDKDLIPAPILERATKASLSEVLRINKPKPKEEKNG